MADELDPKNPNEPIGRNQEEIISTADDEEEFEDIDEEESDEDDLEA